jgi:hypothetical protein
MGCFSIFLGLLLVAIGFVTMIVGRMWLIAARYKQNDDGMDKARNTILVGVVMALTGFALMFLLPSAMRN